MTISLKHQFTSTNPDGPDSSQVQPSNWNSEHTLTCSTDRMLGRTTAGTGAVEEISVGTGLSLSAGSLAVGTVPVANGGTGATSLTANNVLLGNGTSAIQVVAPGTSGNVLTSNGTTWTSAAVPNGWTQIATLTTTSGTTATFTSIPTTYSELLAVYAAVSHDGGGGASDNLRVQFSTDGTTYTNALTGASLAASTTASGGVFIPGYTKGTGAGIFSPQTTANLTTSTTSANTFGWRLDGGLIYMQFFYSLGSAFDAGTITLFGR